MSISCRVAILIPCYNEAITIEKVVNDFKYALPHADIYVYDNNSTDKTKESARAAGAIVRDEHQQGKGNVVRRMFRDIDADFLLWWTVTTHMTRLWRPEWLSSRSLGLTI